MCPRWIRSRTACRNRCSYGSSESGMRSFTSKKRWFTLFTLTRMVHPLNSPRTIAYPVIDRHSGLSAVEVRASTNSLRSSLIARPRGIWVRPFGRCQHFFLGKLQVVESRVAPALCQQLCVCSALPYLPVLQHKNFIGFANGSQAVRDHKHRAPLHQIAQRLLHIHF